MRFQTASRRILSDDQPQTKNCLIVDDELILRNLLQKYFVKLGMKAEKTASNGVEAVDEYIKAYEKGDKISLITMDLTMPEMDGKEACRRIRAFERENGLLRSTILIISGNCSASE